LWFTGENERALVLAEEAQELAEAIGDTKVRITTALDVGQICLAMGDYRRGADICVRATNLIEGELTRDLLDRAFYPFVTLRTSLAICHAELGEFVPAMIAARESMSFTESIQQPGTIVTALSGLSSTLLIRGEFPVAIPYLERAADICKTGYTGMYPNCAARLGLAYAMDARHGQARTLLDEAVARVRGLSPRNEVRVMLSVIEGYLSCDRHQEALVIARHALDLARSRNERGSEARALWLLAELASKPETQNLQQAEENYGRALSRSHDLGMRPIVAHCHLGLGTLDHSVGKREQAQEHLAAATTMYREMDMTYWLGQAEGELRKLS
jgi:tetratricopeptide (TPR) repeat protein